MEYISLVVTITLAFVGYCFAYYHSRSVASREAQLERVNLQVRRLYGPLYAMLNQSRDTWVAFTENYWPEHGKSGYFVDGMTTDEDKMRWRLWMNEVFMPLNEKMEETIIDNADLIVGGQIPDVFKKALAHIAGYRPVMKKWAAGDFSEHTSISLWPGKEMYLEVEKSYMHLLERQQQLISGLGRE